MNPRTFILVVPLLGQTASAIAAVLIEGPALTLSTETLFEELATLPAPVAAEVRSSAQRVIEFVNDVYERKALAQAADSMGLESDPNVRYRIAAAREKVLATALIERKKAEIMASLPDFLPRAQEIYTATKEQYSEPEQVRVRHILLRAPTPEDKATRRAEAHQALTRLQNGERFDELAVELSDDQGSKISGGDLGFIARGKTVRPFEDAAFSLASPGDLSEIVETKFGLHILKLEGRRAAHQRSFEEVRDRIVAKLRADYTNQQLAGWKDSLVGPAAARVDDGVLNEFLSDVLPKNQPAAP